MIPDGVRETWREMAARVGIGGKGEVEGERDAVTVGGVAGEETRLEGYGAVTGEREFGVVGYDHGVKEAEKMNKSENASEYTSSIPKISILTRAFCFFRYMDATSIGVCHTQKLHFYKGTPYGCGHAEGCEGPQGLGMGHWEEETEGAERCLKDGNVAEERFVQRMAGSE